MAMEAVLKQESMTDIVRKYGVSTPVTGSDVIKLIKPIKYICWNNLRWVKANISLYIKKDMHVVSYTQAKRKDICIKYHIRIHTNKSFNSFTGAIVLVGWTWKK